MLTGIIKFARLIRDGLDYEQVNVKQLVKLIVNNYQLADKEKDEEQSLNDLEESMGSGFSEDDFEKF